MIIREKITESTLPLSALSDLSGFVDELDVAPIPNKILDHAPSRPRRK